MYEREEMGKLVLIKLLQNKNVFLMGEERYHFPVTHNGKSLNTVNSWGF